MRILICGAHGFAGRRIASALEQAGHQVLRGARQGADVTMDFVTDTTAEAWLPRLQGVDAVVNAVGVLRNSARTPMTPIHTDAPAALFDACARAGVRRVVHLSALGITTSGTQYARSKHAAEARLLDAVHQGTLDAVCLRPSLLFGLGGASTAMLLALARLPVALLPAELFRTQVQPLHVDDLAQAVVALLAPGSTLHGPLDCVGPLALPLAGYLASLRGQLGHAPARVYALPAWVSRSSARLGDLLPCTPWGSETLALLAQDNVADGQPFARLLGHSPCPPGRFLDYGAHCHATH